MAGGANAWAAGWQALGAGHAAEAERLARAALRAGPESADAWLLLGAARHTQGQPAEAAECYGHALCLRPEVPEAHNNLGAALRALGRPVDAEACFRAAVRLKPDFAEAHNNLGVSLREQGRSPEAEGCYRQALALRCDYPEALNNLGNALREQARPGEAEMWYRRALQLRSGYAEAHANLGVALRDLGRLSEAESCFVWALQLRPDYHDAALNLGNTLREMGRADESTIRLRQARARWPESTSVHDGLLLSLHYQAGMTPRELAAAHAEYDQQHAAPLRAGWRPHDNDRNPNRPLRLGLVSPDLGRHPVAFLLVRAVEALARATGKIVCYSDRRAPPDNLTERFQKAAFIWRDVVGHSHEQLAEQVRHDGIDVLIDLAGHTADNRLPAFARRPAPIQCTWLGYEGATGLNAIDYLIADERLVPFGAEGHYQERVLRLPGGYAVYDPPADAPDPGPPPALANGPVTFGCFNNPAKLSPPALASFAGVLRRVPNARLVLQYRGLDDPAVGGRLRAQFDKHGIRANRVALHGATRYAEYLASYRSIDIALDPWPFGGGVTTCDALWMGVPIVTLPGATFASRHGLSHLHSAGLDQAGLVATDPEDYQSLAADLACDLSLLTDLRSGLRERMSRSALCDGQRLADELLAVLRPAWRKWASGHAENGA